MKVSVIIPIYNEEKVISECLESLSKQTYKDLEIILVDDGSSDKTLNILSNLQFSIPIRSESIFPPKARLAKGGNFQFFKQNHKGPGEARNLGAKHAIGKILVFVDSDMTFDSEFVNMLVEPIIGGRAKGTFSKEEYVKNNQNQWSVCWGINEGWEKGRRHPKNYPDHQKVFRAILKSEFERVGGFMPIGYTDDWTLSEKLGYEAIAAKGARFYHENPGTLSEVYKQAKWIGKRKYKLGKIGTLIAAVRSSFPVSLLFGITKSILNISPAFFVFKVTYDLGIFVGALSVLIGGKSAK
ncbi:MAG: hypothetical protein A2694_04140 [Candidatus Blackburnbacteria bacterium RIFCSPHIGHO2_01_FULL_40_17]|nr:MAG: hypothetical protein UT38_C0001G0042 [Microgenomates group bacterium GW2011_GWA2_39_19]OGY06942.1 MAG: hypothetical protein A2694_04140 [Candidatus Blackburnbacteria bacterium RIFCSPHIGHO2_01_FULL_40_17]HBL52248.1 hypothetical protein [Candidatus Blackburnbacteria bacterium]